jgi:hypothetical protein
MALELHGDLPSPVRLLGLTAMHLLECDGSQQLRLF